MRKLFFLAIGAIIMLSLGSCEKATVVSQASADVFIKSIKDAIEISVVDGSGRNVSYSKINIEGTELELNYNKLANGVYQIRIKGNEIGVLNSRITILK